MLSKMLRHCYNGDPTQLFRKHALDSFQVVISPCERQPGDFKTECLEVARESVEQHEKIVILYSGGADSEVALLSFLASGVDLMIATVSHKFNQPDVIYAKKFCEERGLKHTVIELDLDRFIDAGMAHAYGIKYQCAQLAQLIIMWLIEQVDDGHSLFVLGGDAMVTKHDGEWFYQQQEQEDCCWARYTALTGRNVIGFLYYSPEQVLAYLRDPLICQVLTNKIPGKLGLRSTKNQVYRSYWPEMQPRKKLDGFEGGYMLNSAVAWSINQVLTNLGDTWNQVLTNLGDTWYLHIDKFTQALENDKIIV